jgi:ABC-type phosphate/phosphonate transport system ATPase subunit
VIGAFHQPAAVAKYCTRAIGIRMGKIVYDGPALISARQLEHIYGDSESESYLPVHQSGVQPPYFGSGLQPALHEGVTA